MKSNHKIKADHFRVKPSKKVRLAQEKTQVRSYYVDDEDYKNRLEEFGKTIKDFQERLYAAADYAFLLIFQGMDTSGKDGAISHTMSMVNPQGVYVSNFKQPSTEELRHGFLWRTVAKLPGRGEIGIFNRSYYEDVLISRVHRAVFDTQKLPPHLKKLKGFWSHRMADIAAHEAYLSRQGTQVVKIFLHISKEQQKVRLLERIENPQKVWKLSEKDFTERKYWKDYAHAYESALSHTSTKESPWYIVPADDKRNARLIISEIILSELKKLNLQYPTLSKSELARLTKLGKSL